MQKPIKTSRKGHVLVNDFVETLIEPVVALLYDFALVLRIGHITVGTVVLEMRHLSTTSYHIKLCNTRCIVDREIHFVLDSLVAHNKRRNRGGERACNKVKVSRNGV